MKISIIGTVGVPGRYGGFETLAENLVRHHHFSGNRDVLTVYCSAKPYTDRPPRHLSAKLRYSRLEANGAQSILYDAITLLDAARRGSDVALVLGVSGAMILPLIRLVSRMRIVTNVDGIEWKRDKWKGLARHVLRLSERTAMRFSDRVIADNQGIAEYLLKTYGVQADMIAYGGDHALEAASETANSATDAVLPDDYALALCRIEPENNVAIILEAFANAQNNLVFVGNWDNSDYGRQLRTRYGKVNNLWLLDPIYETEALYRIRARAKLYVHGHSAGGTNPALVEMMHFGIPVIAFDCVYNRHTTEEQASYFSSAESLASLVVDQNQIDNGPRMREIAQRYYTWTQISNQYFNLLREVGAAHLHTPRVRVRTL